MDDNTRKMLQEMDLFGGHALSDAMRAEEFGLQIPFHIVEVLVRGRPLSRHIEGPTVRTELHIQHMPIASDLNRFRDKVYQAANGVFHQQPVFVDQCVSKAFDPGYWYLGFNG